MLIHNRIVVLRAERKLSRAQLAASVGVNPQTIGFLERGNYTPSLELAFKICRFFNGGGLLARPLSSFERSTVRDAAKGGLRWR
jgi:DNA-binding XRE family transcriptional regulator